MFIDALTLVCDAQAFTAAAVSGSSYDCGAMTPQRAMGAGEPLGFGIFVDVAASSTTVKIEIIMATDAALTAGIIVLDEQTRLSADLFAGASLYMGLPPQPPAAGYLRYLGLRVTPAGGAATVTLTADLMPRDLFAAKAQYYARNYTV